MQIKDDCDDELLHKAIDLLLDRDTVSEFILQRNLWIGYGKATVLLENLESLGYVSARSSGCTRSVLIGKES